MRRRPTISSPLKTPSNFFIVTRKRPSINANCTRTLRLLRSLCARRFAAVEVLKSTMRTRDYVEKGETEGKSLLDAMRDGDTEGMQHFDGEIEKLIRAGIVDFEVGMTYSSNAGNLRLEMADFVNERPKPPAASKPAAHDPNRATEIEIER